jgi:hypothetical protein
VVFSVGFEEVFCILAPFERVPASCLITHCSRFPQEWKTLISIDLSICLKNSAILFKMFRPLAQLESDIFSLIDPKRKKSFRPKSEVQAGCGNRSDLEASVHS